MGFFVPKNWTKVSRNLPTRQSMFLSHDEHTLTNASFLPNPFFYRRFLPSPLSLE